MDSTPTHPPLRSTQIIAPTTTKGQPFPGSAEHQLYTATLHDLGHVDRVYLSLDLVRTVVDSLAPYYAYHGRRLFFREKKLRAIARKAHRYIHSSQWVNATPPVAQFTVQDQRQRSMIAAWRRTTNKEGDYCEILAFLGEHTLDEANQRWNRTKVWRARDWARKACFTTTTSPRSEEGKEINIQEDILTEDSLSKETSFPACARKARTREAQQKGCHDDTLSTTAGAESPISAIQARTAHLGRKVKGYSDSDSKRCPALSMAAPGGDGMAAKNYTPQQAAAALAVRRFGLLTDAIGEHNIHAACRKRRKAGLPTLRRPFSVEEDKLIMSGVPHTVIAHLFDRFPEAVNSRHKRLLVYIEQGIAPRRLGDAPRRSRAA